MRWCCSRCRPGATAVGNPARIVQKSADAQREEAAAKMGFSAYGVTQGDDPVAQAMKGLIDNASGHEHQIALLWQAIEKLSARSRELPTDDCVPQDARTDRDGFDAERLKASSADPGWSSRTRPDQSSGLAR
jgi:serine O-acetyltransferase